MECDGVEMSETVIRDEVWASIDDLEVGNELRDEQAEKIDAWLEDRHGSFTASNFGKLMQRGRAKDEEFGQTAMAYIFDTAAEVVGSHKFGFSSKPTDWGNDNEQAAKEAYEKVTGNVVDYDSHRFMVLNEYIGGSPDGLVGSDGVTEFKCPYDPGKHIQWTVADEVPAEHIWQCVGHCLVTNRQWCDFVSFDPRIEGPLRLFIKRYERDSRVDQLKERLELAVDRLQAICRVLMDKAKEY